LKCDLSNCQFHQVRWGFTTLPHQLNFRSVHAEWNGLYG